MQIMLQEQFQGVFVFSFSPGCARKKHVKKPFLDPEAPLGDSKAVLLGAYWFRPEKCARGGMSRTVRWPRKKSNQKNS
jgi:hypothetical protein